MKGLGNNWDLRQLNNKLAMDEAEENLERASEELKRTKKELEAALLSLSQ